MSFADFQTELIKRLADNGIDATIKMTNEPFIVEVDLVDDEGEDFYVGNCADPGLHVKWLGEHSLDGGEKEPFVCLNHGVTMSAYPKHVAGWVVGYDG